ncbi:MAG: HAD hydrolase family protein, partial [Anaerotignum sp.]|nr:HAD hydrolase family protein [Anaerotignum sp.]
MRHVSIIFFDIDGTLLDHQTKRVSEKTRETLKRLKEKGIK